MTSSFIPQLNSGATLWFTGLPCSGKSTLASLVAHQLRNSGHRVEILDGDLVRATLCRGLGFSKADRDENVARIGWLCGVLSKHGIVAIGAAVSPYRDARSRLRASLPRFVEIYVKAPLAVCMKRDLKGLYARAINGEIRNFTGVDDPYEEPLSPEIVVETDKNSMKQCTDLIVDWIRGVSDWRSPGSPASRPVAGLEDSADTICELPNS